MRLNTNILALTAYTAMLSSEKGIATSTLRMSSGVKLNSVKDDPANYSIAGKLDLQVTGIERASKNSLDGISLIQTLDGALNSVQEMLQECRELSVQAATDTLEDADREKINLKIQSLKEEINQLSSRTEFNTIKLLKGDAKRLTYPLDIADPTKNTLLKPVDATTKITYVSSSVPEGSLQYTIDSAALPATLELGSLPPTGATALGLKGNININSSLVTITEDMTQDDINDAVSTALTRNNIDRYGTQLITKEQGEEAVINISGDSAILSAAGLVAANEQGKNMEVSGIKFLDPTGAPDDTFNSGMYTVIKGNQLLVKSTNGQEIDIDVKFKVNPDGSFRSGAETIDSTTGALSGGGVNETKVLNSGQLVLQIGGSKDNELDLYIREISTHTLGLDYTNVSTFDGAQKAITTFDNAIQIISAQRASIGAYQNRLQFNGTSLDTAYTNTSEALSRVRDADLALEMINNAKYSVKVQAGIAMISQANQRPQMVLQLLG